MSFTWRATGEGEEIKRQIYQELVDNQQNLETRIKAGCDTHTMSKSGRQINQTPAGSDPLRKHSWRAGTSPFTREFVEDNDIAELRSAINPLWDDRNTCRVYYGSDFQDYRSTLRTSDFGTYQNTQNNYCGSHLTGYNNARKGTVRSNDRHDSRDYNHDSSHDGSHDGSDDNDGCVDYSLAIYKENITPSLINGLDIITNLEIVDYTYKADETKLPRVGIILDYSPSLFTSKAGNTLDMMNTVGVLLKAVQELKHEVDETRAELEATRAHLEEVTHRGV
ncbi:MAG: tail fiber domain-containing protein [Actinobacteria bacterium]|nr:tail fiber domain-containing protein [Actinomycetota bacterium]MCA1807039.1 tail fiber domain-containing protein [Actinomycetota bacterium]